MDAMIVNTTDTSSLNALITLALKQTIHAAVQAAIEDKLDNLDADTASVAASLGQRIAALDRFTAGLDRALVTSIGDQFSFNTQMQSRILALEKRLDTLSLINTAQEDALTARIQVLEDEVGRLQHANQARDQERNDTIADIVDTRLEIALADVDLTEQVRNVLADATITI